MSGADVAGTEKVNATEPASNAANMIFDRMVNLLNGRIGTGYLVKTP
jgi:hypothetical protein